MVNGFVILTRPHVWRAYRALRALRWPGNTLLQYMDSLEHEAKSDKASQCVFPPF
jgi:hypothetical protein